MLPQGFSLIRANKQHWDRVINFKQKTRINDYISSLKYDLDYTELLPSAYDNNRPNALFVPGYIERIVVPKFVIQKCVDAICVPLIISSSLSGFIEELD